MIAFSVFLKALLLSTRRMQEANNFQVENIQLEARTSDECKKCVMTPEIFIGINLIQVHLYHDYMCKDIK